MFVEILADTMNVNNNHRITTFHCEYPQMIHEHVLTHRALSRNSMSGRAVSSFRMMNLDTVHPLWTEEQKGMGWQFKPSDEVSTLDALLEEYYNQTLHFCDKLQTLNVHHQDINVYLKPFRNIHTVITATEWGNFFELRTAPTVHPMMLSLALLMRETYETSVPELSDYHVPTHNKEIFSNLEFLVESRLATAKLARYSYHSDKDFPDHKNFELFRKLLTAKHMSPFEHCARACSESDGSYYNLRGWMSFRYLIETGGVDELI